MSLNSPNIFRIFCLLLIAAGSLLMQTAFGQGLVVNEISNGRFNNYEFIELIVAVECPNDTGSGLDIRGWRVDDNNGDFACDPISDVGIATGHIRFNYASEWANVPYGSIILLYNNVSKNSMITMPDDPTDANNDGVYIVPVNYLNIEYCAGVPRAAGQSCGNVGATADPSYNCPYPFYNGNPWTTRIRLADLGDAAQTRRADGTYFHGISYGGGEMNGGPDSLMVGHTDGVRKDYYFNGGDYRDVVNFDTFANIHLTPSVQTPGAPNNAFNQSFIDQQQINPCGPLPILLSTFKANTQENSVQLDWTSVMEFNSHAYVIERAPHGSPKFEEIGRIGAGGNSDAELNYRYIDYDPSPGTSFYRLRMVDQDGSYRFSDVLKIQFIGEHIVVSLVYPNPVEEIAHFDIYSAGEYTIGIYDMTGRLVVQQDFFPQTDHETAEFDLSRLDMGMYIYLVYNNRGVTSKGRLLKQ